ncbi:hypothetical protein WN55_04127 [Dufourea novaeangliae]|uniref:Uncharacterized protein n=1 Tax=Dufourea novaeangliae TaxID=178035 RepID=A0A154PLA9_DUFNO|nr:hypothetical protein WN55_04127 [Dufourea novaeangliae]
MAKRKCYKRSRRKQGLYQSQEMLLQKSGSSDTIDSIGNNDTPLRRNVGSSEQLLEQRSPESVLFDSQQLELSCCGDLSPEFAPKLRRRKLDLNNLNTNYEQYESEIQKEMKLFKENQSDVEPQQQKVDTSTLYPMEKTLPMNEEIKVDMHKCESIQNSKSFSNAVLGVRNYNTDFHSFKSMYDLPYGYVSEPGQFSTFNSDVESQNPRFHHFLDEFQSAASVCEPVLTNERNQRKKKNTRNSFSSNLTASKTVWSSCTPESPTASTLDLPAVLDSGGCSRMEFEFSKKCTCATSAQSRSSSRFQFIKKPIHKIIFFCIWLMRKLANTFKQVRRFAALLYNLRQIWKNLKNAVNYVVMTLRSENKQMTDRFLEKVII